MNQYTMHPFMKPLHRIDNVPFDPSSYSCPEDVTPSLPQLTKSSRYTWKDHVVQFFYEHGDCDQKMRYIVSLLAVLRPPKPLHADILLSPVKKQYPIEAVFGPSHVNTGYASDKKVVVYREEEWLKVFIHECFHYFRFEDGLMDPTLIPRIRTLFPVQSKFNLYEAFCEVWARTLNCYLIAAYTHIPVVTLLQKERKYSMRHMVNVLAHMGLTYKRIQRPHSGFKEHTNVLAYIVLANILFHGYLETHPSLNADGESVVRFIEEHAKDDMFIRAVEHTKPHVTTTMTILSMEDYAVERSL